MKKGLTAMVMTIQASADGGFRVTQKLLRPVVYLDHWAVRLFSDEKPSRKREFPDAIAAVFPKKMAVQLCLVHMVRHSLNFVGWKQRKEVAAADLRLIYTAATEDEAQRRLTKFAAKWNAC